jgi:hypothetical protein
MKLNKNQKRFIYFLFLSLGNVLVSQETVISTDFAVRDFQILDNNTIIYIEKRNIKSAKLNSKTNDSLINEKGFFIGGYGLNLFLLRDQRKIITASNELVEDRSSIRFYDIDEKNVNKHKVLYSKRILDFFTSPKDSLLFLSHKDSTIRVYKYGKKPFFRKIDSVKTMAFSRKVKYYNGNIYYITDEGSLNKYNLKTKSDTVISNTNLFLINFLIDQRRRKIYASTITGEILIVNEDDSSKSRVMKLGNSIIEALEIFDDNYLIVGDWKGQVTAINIETFIVKKIQKLNYRVIKMAGKDGYIYASTSKRGIEKWKFKAF